MLCDTARWSAIGLQYLGLCKPGSSIMAHLAHRVQAWRGLARQLRFSSAAASGEVVDEMVSYARSNFKVSSAIS